MISAGLQILIDSLANMHICRDQVKNERGDWIKIKA